MKKLQMKPRKQVRRTRALAAELGAPTGKFSRRELELIGRKLKRLGGKKATLVRGRPVYWI